MDRFGQPDREGNRKRRAREARRGACPICLEYPCRPDCRLHYTKEELDELRDRIDGRDHS